MNRLLSWITAITIFILSLAPVSVGATSPSSGTDYVVQPGDTLAKIALYHYGDAGWYPSIVWATNARAAMAEGYATITDPWAIEPGEKLWLVTDGSVQASITYADVANATYASEWTADGTAPLVSGYYSEPIVEGSASKIQVSLFPRLAFGKTVDGHPLVAAVLFTNGGGSGTFGELVALTGSNGDIRQIAATPLGDRIQIKSLAVSGDKVILDVITHGPNDPMCCPTLHKTLEYVLQNDQLISATQPSDALAHHVWQCQTFTDAKGNTTDIDDPTRYTLSFADGQLT